MQQEGKSQEGVFKSKFSKEKLPLLDTSYLGPHFRGKKGSGRDWKANQSFKGGPKTRKETQALTTGQKVEESGDMRGARRSY